jgi:hypothetical protein
MLPVAAQTCCNEHWLNGEATLEVRSSQRIIVEASAGVVGAVDGWRPRPVRLDGKLCMHAI